MFRTTHIETSDTDPFWERKKKKYENYPVLPSQPSHVSAAEIDAQHEIALVSDKLGIRLAKQALRMSKRGKVEAPRREALAEKTKRSWIGIGKRTIGDDPRSTELAANAALRREGSDVRVELIPGDMDYEGGFDQDTVRINNNPDPR